MNQFHYAFKVRDIESTVKFYGQILNCSIGRMAESWIDFDFFGHQLSAHVSPKIEKLDYCGKVDGIKVPIPHFGCILPAKKFQFVKKQLVLNGVEFVVEPQTRYVGKPEEQQTIFVIDFSGNPIEFKSFLNQSSVFSA